MAFSTEQVKAQAKGLREKHGLTGWDAEMAKRYRDRSRGEKREFWQAVYDRITATRTVDL